MHRIAALAMAGALSLVTFAGPAQAQQTGKDPHRALGRRLDQPDEQGRVCRRAEPQIFRAGRPDRQLHRLRVRNGGAAKPDRRQCRRGRRLVRAHAAHADQGPAPDVHRGVRPLSGQRAGGAQVAGRQDQDDRRPEGQEDRHLGARLVDAQFRRRADGARRRALQGGELHLGRHRPECGRGDAFRRRTRRPRQSRPRHQRAGRQWRGGRARRQPHRGRHAARRSAVPISPTASTPRSTS